jgi:hypothetical protein
MLWFYHLTERVFPSNTLARAKIFKQRLSILVVVKDMSDLEIKLPKILEGEKPRLEQNIKDLVIFEVKRKKLLAFMDEVMSGARQLSDRDLVKYGRELKQGRFKKLKKQGLV